MQFHCTAAAAIGSLLLGAICRAEGPQTAGDPKRPVWNYPSRQRPMSVPVPALQGEPDFSHRQAGSERVSSLPQRRLAASRATRNNPQDDSAPTSYQDDFPSRRTPFHSSPFDRGAPSCPVEPDPGPYRVGPFDDALGIDRGASCNYTWDNIFFFGIAEVFRLNDADARAAARFGLNWGLPIFDDNTGSGFQIGGSGSVAEEGPQGFATSGIFYRSDLQFDSAWNLGAVVDWMQDDAFQTETAQLRGKASITLDRKNEIGAWGAASLIDDDNENGEPVESVDQINLFYRHLFDSGWDVTGWVGWRSDPSSAALGIDAVLPINDFWALIFGGHDAPDGDTWSVYSGVLLHWGPRATQDYLGQDRHQPYLPVADNTSMTLFTRQ